jgi:putative SOS response-associated peptidase YedK
MPVILERDDEEVWLDSETVEADMLHSFLKPFLGDSMEEWQVGAEARNPIKDYPEVIEQVKSSRQGTLF